MRALLLVFAAAGASLATSAALWVAIEQRASAWCEVVNPRLVRTTASPARVNQAIAEVLRDARVSSPQSCREKASAWFTAADDYGMRQEKLSRLVREETDATGRRLRVEMLSGPDMPTLVFVEQEDGEGSATITRQIADRIAASGARPL